MPRATPDSSAPTAPATATKPAASTAASPALVPVNNHYHYPAQSAPRRPANPAWPWAIVLIVGIIMALALTGLVATYWYRSIGKNCGVATPCPAVAPCPNAAPCPSCPTCPAQRQRKGPRKPAAAPVAKPTPVCTPTPKPACGDCGSQPAQTGGFTEDPPVTRPTNNTFTEDKPVTRPADNRPRRTSQDRSENQSVTQEQINAAQQAAYNAGVQDAHAQASQQQGPSTKAVIAATLLQLGGSAAQAAINRNNGQYIPNGQGGYTNNSNQVAGLMSFNCAFIGVSCR